jgi:hypothetical protein
VVEAVQGKTSEAFKVFVLESILTRMAFASPVFFIAFLD